MPINPLAPIADQRQILYIFRSLEVPPDENVLETELIVKVLHAGIRHPDECVTELIGSGHIYRIKAPSGDFIRRTEK